MTEVWRVGLLALCAYGMGFLEAMPIGATQLEIARRAMHGHRSAALMVVVGSVLSDSMYGVIAFLGIAPLLQGQSVQAVFWGANALVLALVGILAIRDSRRSATDGGSAGRSLTGYTASFTTGLSLAVTNPLMIVWWLLGARILEGIGVVRTFDVPTTIMYVVSGSLGIGSYLSVLAFGILKVKATLREHHIRRITFAFGIVLIGLAAFAFTECVSSLDARASEHPVRAVQSVR